MPLALWLNLARSGGTLLARCLGCMEGVALLSEAHPLGTRIIDAAEQACRWHGLLRPDELGRWGGGRGRFDELMALLVERAAARGRTLVVRDWSHLDFLGAPFVEPAFFSRSMRLLDRLGPRVFATVRHPADQWASQQRLDLLKGAVDPRVYLRGCRAFAELASRTGFVRYEDFTLEPAAHLARLCAGLGAPFDERWVDRYGAYDRVTGDVEATARSVGEIRPATRREIAAEVRVLFEASEDYHAACRLLGYEP